MTAEAAETASRQLLTEMGNRRPTAAQLQACTGAVMAAMGRLDNIVWQEAYIRAQREAGDLA